MIVELIRQQILPTQTLGILIVPGKELFVCKTLELPWKENQHDISCIPVGEYPCSFEFGGHITGYHVKNVKNRSAIFIHSANYASQLKGCIALGDGNKDINKDGQLDVIHSGSTVNRLHARLQYQDFTLLIHNN